ncbi:MAG: YcxB family protein [Cellulosilyticaceae bacterium]
MIDAKAKQVKVDVRLHVKDVYRYNMYVAYQSKISKGILSVGVILGIWMLYSMITTEQRLDLFLSENIIWIVAAGFALVATPLKVWGITAQQMQSPIFSGTSNYIFQKENITLKVNDMEDIVPWETYQMIVETKNDFRFFVDKVQAQIIPKHNMTAETIQELREIIREANPKECYKLKEQEK